MDLGDGYSFRISPHAVVRDRSPAEAPDEWREPEDYPVLARNVYGTNIGSLRKQWFKWIRITERKKQAIREATLLLLDRHGK